MTATRGLNSVVDRLAPEAQGLALLTYFVKVTTKCASVLDVASSSMKEAGPCLFAIVGSQLEAD